jgi:hypothetical protein
MIEDHVVLTARCERTRHLVFRVLDTANGLVIEAPRYAAGRERKQWTPLGRKLRPGCIERYGCACGRSELISHDLISADIRRGETEWIIEGTNISLRRRSGMGEQASG